jgi:hypothetical protein
MLSKERAGRQGYHRATTAAEAKNLNLIIKKAG